MGDKCGTQTPGAMGVVDMSIPYATILKLFLEIIYREQTKLGHLDKCQIGAIHACQHKIELCEELAGRLGVKLPGLT